MSVRQEDCAFVALGGWGRCKGGGGRCEGGRSDPEGDHQLEIRR